MSVMTMAKTRRANGRTAKDKEPTTSTRIFTADSLALSELAGLMHLSLHETFRQVAIPAINEKRLLLMDEKTAKIRGSE